MNNLRIAGFMSIFLLIVFAIFPSVAFATSDHPVVVSLGDSYSSGEGVEPFYKQNGAWNFFKSDSVNSSNCKEYYDWLAHRSESSWPGKLKVKNSAGTEITLSDAKYDEAGASKDASWYFVASSGATTEHLNGGTRYDVEKDNAYETDGKQEKIVKYYKKWDLTGRDTSSFKCYLSEQLDVFNKIEAGTVDYVTMTIGGNDVGFGDIVTAAATESWGY